MCANTQHTVSLLQAAAQAKKEGKSCPEALFAAYREELGEKEPFARELAERLPALMGLPDLCDVFAATFSIIAQLTGLKEGYAEAARRMHKEYGSNSCGSDGEETCLCTMRMKDCVLLIEHCRWTCTQDKGQG